MSEDPKLLADALALIDSAPNRREATQIYADLLSKLSGASVFWEPINRAIMAKWSRSGLIYIKRRAWKMAGKGAP